MARKKTTDEPIEELARAVKRSFDEVATRQEVRALGTQVGDGFEAMISSLDLVRQDIHDIKITLGPIVQHMAATERRVNELERRLVRVERRVGLTR